MPSSCSYGSRAPFSEAVFACSRVSFPRRRRRSWQRIPESRNLSTSIPSLVESLSVDAIDFERIYVALIEADFTDDLRLDPSTGVDIRINSEQAPFGPEPVPEGAMVAHVSLEQAGLIRDLFVDEQTGEIYRYESPA